MEVRVTQGMEREVCPDPDAGGRVRVRVRVRVPRGWCAWLVCVCVWMTLSGGVFDNGDDVDDDD